jgi:peptidyl-prolyl cis-trans isomerase SurA
VVDSYHDFIDAKVLEYADSRLELDIPEFGELIDEYRHGLMIFAYNDQMVWSRALKDTLGFERFYAQASKQHHWGDSADAVYFWNERARVNCYTIADSTLLSKNKALKVIEKGHKKGWGTEKVIEELVAKVSKKDASKVSNELILVEKGNQQLLSNKEWGMGTYVHNLDSGSYQILVVEQMLQPELKSRDEARGFYLNDFQNYLEDQNNTALRKKYNVKIHQDVLDKIVY